MKREIKPLFKIDWTQPQHLIVRITSEDAEKVLTEYNDGNRLRRLAGSNYMARQIKSGEWVEDHPQPICFSSDGKLLDGQHRMAGIALAKESVWASVRFGVNPELMKYIDTGISRPLFDRVKFVDDPSVNKTIAAMLAVKYMMKSKGKISPDAALSLYYEMEESYRSVAEIRSSTKHMGTAIVGVAFADYHVRYGVEALEMYKELFQKTTNCQQAQALKIFLMTTDKVSRDQYPYIVSCCIANHEGREVKKVMGATWR